MKISRPFSLYSLRSQIEPVQEQLQITKKGKRQVKKNRLVIAINFSRVIYHI